MPREWGADPQRCQAAGLPAPAHRTKPQLGLELLERALDAGVPAAWVVADEVYGSDGTLRRALEARSQASVLAVRSNEHPSTWPPYGPPAQSAVATLAAALPREAWRLRCGEGVQGPRRYDWASIPLRPALREDWLHALLIRRHPARPAEVASYLVYVPRDRPLGEIVRAAGTRWTIEAVFKLAKGQVGLDHYEVRSCQGWYRHITLALLALAALAIGAAKRGEPFAPCTSLSPSPRSVACSSVSPGPRRAPPDPSARGRGGDGATRRVPRQPIAVAA